MKLLFASVILIAAASLTSSCHKLFEGSHTTRDTTGDADRDYLTVDRSRFSCKVNGVEFIPKTRRSRDILRGSFNPVYIIQELNYFFIRASYEVDSISRDITLGIYPITSAGEYTLAPVDSPGYSFGGATYGGFFSTDSLHRGKITVTIFDSVKRHIAGTFSFVGYDSIRRKTITITDGVFNL